MFKTFFIISHCFAEFILSSWKRPSAQVPDDCVAGKQNTFYSQVADGIVMILDNDKSRTISACEGGGGEERSLKSFEEKMKTR